MPRIKLTATTQAEPESDCLASARAAARWILRRQFECHWPSTPDTPHDEQLDLYYGNAGTILFFLELAELTHEQSYRESALTGAAYIATQVERTTTFGLYRGLAGIAFALDQVKRLSEDCSLLNSLDLAIDRLRASAKEGHPGVQWNDSNDLFSGTAGIGLALVHLVRGTDRKDLLELAKGAGEFLLARAHESVYGGYWTSSTTHSTLYPNFSHGTAGIGFFMAELYEATHDERYRTSALAAGRYLRAVASKAETSNGLIFHDDAAGRDLFYLGWCHGPAGTGRFFYRLYQLSNDSDWLDVVNEQAVTLMASGIPEQQTPGYWNNVSRCCGAAGVGEFFLGLYRAARDKSYLQFAERVAVYLIAKAERHANEMKWTQADRRIEPYNVTAQTGLMQGAAGVGLFLVHLDQAYRHQKQSIRFPDEPSWEHAGFSGATD